MSTSPKQVQGETQRSVKYSYAGGSWVNRAASQSRQESMGAYFVSLVDEYMKKRGDWIAGREVRRLEFSLGAIRLFEQRLGKKLRQF